MNSIHHKNLLLSMEKAIDDFGFFKSKNIRLAFSGGKDSFVTAILLRDLNIPFEAVAVDMGYSENWGDRLSKKLEAYNIGLNVIKAHSDSIVADMKSIHRNHYTQGLIKLSEIDPIKPKVNVSPCTHCYNSKVHCVAAGYSSSSTELVFGHHETDAIASLLKSYLMYVDSIENHSYDYIRFRNLVNNTADLLTSKNNTKLLNDIEIAIDKGFSGTDEPPRQSVVDRNEVEIIRPLWYVEESVIESFALELKLSLEGSGCGHGASKKTRTPREIVHWELLPVLKDNAYGLDSLLTLRRLLKQSITYQGRTIINVRNNRSHILGPSYKQMTAIKL